MHKNKSLRFLEQLLPQLEKDQPFEAVASRMKAAAKRNKEAPPSAYLPPAFIAAKLGAPSVEGEAAPPLAATPSSEPATDEAATPAAEATTEEATLSLPAYEVERPLEQPGETKDELPALEEAFLASGEKQSEAAAPEQLSAPAAPVSAPSPLEEERSPAPYQPAPLTETKQPEATPPLAASLETTSSKAVDEAALEEFDIPVIDNLDRNFSATEEKSGAKAPKQDFFNEQLQLLKQNSAAVPQVREALSVAPPTAEEATQPRSTPPSSQAVGESEETRESVAEGVSETAAPSFESFSGEAVSVEAPAFEVPALEAEVDAVPAPPSSLEQSENKTLQQNKAGPAAVVGASALGKAERILDNDYLYQKVLNLIQGYREENLETVLGAFSSDKFSDEALEEVAQLVLANTPEEEVVAKVQQLTFSNAFIALPPEREKKAAEEKLVKEAFETRRAKRRVALFSVAAFLGLALFLTYFFGYEALRARYHYSKAYALLEEKRFEASEAEFQTAYALMPNWKEVNKIAALQVRLKRYRAAEEKYQLSLQLNPQAPLTLTAYGKLFYLEGTFPAAVAQLQRALSVEAAYLPARELLAELYVEWGHQAAEKLALADQLYKALLESNPERAAYYYSQSLLVSVLKGNYPLSKFYYLKTLAQQPAAVPQAAFSYYLYFLANTYEDRNAAAAFEAEQGEAAELAEERRSFENTYLISTAAVLEKTLFSAAADYLPFYQAAARWHQATKNTAAGLEWAERGTAVYAEKGSPRYFPAEAFFSLAAELAYQEGKTLEALEALSQALTINPKAGLAHLHLARLQLLELNQTEKAQQQLLLAAAHFPAFNPLESAEVHFKKEQELAYLLGYVFYQQAKRNNSDAAMQRALHYWTELNLVRAQAGKKQRPYLFDYTLGAAYLFLKKYDLAQGLLSSHLDELKNALLLYEEREEVGEEVRYRLVVLSELYNNLGVALLGRGQNQALPLRQRQQALEYFINSIALKDKLGLLKGVPYANFFSLSATETSTGRTVGTQREALKIADEFFPKTLLEDLPPVYQTPSSALRAGSRAGG